MPKLGNLASRFLVAVVAAPILILAMYQNRPEFVWALVFGGSLLAMWEFFSMSLEDSTDRWASLLFGAGASAILFWVPVHKGGQLLPLFVAVVPVALYYLFRFGDMQTAARRLAFSIAGIIYAGLLFQFLALLKRDLGGDLGGHFVLFVLVVTWAGDTGAYFAGRFLGKTKLYPAVSPGKTWAGAFGGLAGSAAAAAGIKLGLMTGSDMAVLPWFGWVDVFLIAIPGAALGQMGDLVESMIKRSTGVKDSGSILPGHGGILDRVDAVLIVAPWTYLYLLIRPQLFS